MDENSSKSYFVVETMISFLIISKNLMYMKSLVEWASI